MQALELLPKDAMKDAKRKEQEFSELHEPLRKFRRAIADSLNTAAKALSGVTKLSLTVIANAAAGGSAAGSVNPAASAPVVITPALPGTTPSLFMSSGGPVRPFTATDSGVMTGHTEEVRAQQH